MVEIGKPGTRAELIVPPDVLDFSLENEWMQEQVSSTLVGDDSPDLDEPETFYPDRHEIAQSPSGQYHVCTLRKHDAVLLFEHEEFQFKKDIIEPQTPNVTDAGTVIVTRYADEGYPDGKHFLSVWDEAGITIFTTELRAHVDFVRLSHDTRFIACYTADELTNYSKRDKFTVNIIDLESESIRARYTDQIPGISAGGGGGLQIWEMRFVYDGSETLLALFDVEQPDVPSNDNLTLADLPSGTPLIDMDGNLVEFGQPNINNHPGHYSLTKKGQKRVNQS